MRFTVTVEFTTRDQITVANMENAADADARLAPPPPFPWIPPLATYITGPVVAESEQASALKAIVEAVTASMPPGSRQQRRVCPQDWPDGGVDGEDGLLMILLQTLGPYLTHEDDVKRTRAITLLSRVLMAAPGLVTNPLELHHLAEFYTSRLMDWPALRGALEGCVVLADFVDEDGDGSDGDAVRRQAAARSGNTSTNASTNASANANNNGEKAAFAGLNAGFFGPRKTPARRPPTAGQATRLPPQAPRLLPPPLRLCDHDAVALLTTIADSVYVRSLAAHDRSLVFTLISKLVTAYGDVALSAEVDLAELMVVSMDGEKDPGCLFDAFQALQAVCGAFCRLEERDVALEMMRRAEEELFDVLACYFPVSFEPKERSARGITREDLAGGLEGCLLAWPGFYEDALDMVEEKMGSIVKRAKVDSMRLLAGLCARSGGVAGIGNASPRRVWSMLRGDVVGAGECQFFGKDHPIVLSTLAQCLAGNGRNEGNEGLGREVLGDVVVGDCMSCLDPDVEGYSESTEGAAFERQVGLTRSTALIFRACALAGGPVWRRAVEKHAMSLAELFLYHVRSTNVPQMCFTLLLLYALLADVGQLSGSADCATTKKMDEWGNAIRCAHDVLCTFVVMHASIWGAEVGADDPLAWTVTTGECSFVWPTDPSEYNFAVLLATSARSLDAISCFDDMWVEAEVPAYVLACSKVMRVDHEGVAAVARCALENVCASSYGRRHDVTKNTVDLLLQELGGGDGGGDGGGNGGGNGDGTALPRSVMDAIFHFLASVCVEDGERGPSRRPAVLKELRERLTSADDLARGLVILEGEPDSVACAEEVAVLEEILTRVAASGSPDSHDSHDSPDETDANVSRASFGVCKRMTREDQRRVLRDRLATLGNGRCDSALLGCVLGLYPDVAADHRGLLRALVTLSTGTKTSELARYAAASVANKTAATDPDGVLEALDALIASLPEGEPHSVEVFLNALAKQGGDVIEGALQRVVAAGRSAALRSLVGSPADTDASSRTDAYISAQSHATVAFLWEQKAYTKAKRCLMSVEADHTAALVHLIAGLPPALVRTDKACVCAQLCAFLERMSLDNERALLADVGVDEQSLERVLRVFGGLIALPETAERVGAFLPVLLHLVLHARYAGARQAALDCLAQIARDIPYQTIHPHRRAIVKTVVAACDDRKRAVRATAVSCRELY